MPYLTSQDITDRFGSSTLDVLADKDGDGNADTATVDAALADASEQVDLYLSSRYQVPLSNPPALVKRLCADIAIYFLGRQMIGGGEERRKRYEDAVAMLKDIAAGKAGLGIPEADQQEPAGGSLDVSSDERLFTRDSLKGF